MKPPETLDDIVSAGLCLGCGLCAALADPVAMTTTTAGLLRPRVDASLSEGTMDRMRVTCPGVRVDGSEPPLAMEAMLDRVWGPIVSLRRAAACDGGGLAEALARHLLDSGQVESLLMDDAAEKGPRPGILTGLRQRLEEGRFLAVFGRPCDIAGLRNLAHLDNRVERLAVLTVSHFCNGLTASGAPAVKDSGAALQFRCRICPDSSGEQADIVVGLAGDGRIPQGDLDDDSAPELGLPLIGRSLRGEAVIRVAESAGVIATAPLSVRELARCKSELQDRKQDLWAKLAALMLSRRRRPRYRSLRIWTAGRPTSWARKWRVFRAFRKELKQADPL